MVKSLWATAIAVLLGTSSVMAADIVQPGYDWTGFYLGAQAGADMYNANNVGSSSLPNSTGIEGGLNAQFLKQFNQLVIGAVVDGNVSSNNASGWCTTSNNTSCTLSSGWNASVRGKLGFAADKVMFYGTGGWGWADFNKTSSHNNDYRSTLNGWVAGAGIGYAVNDNWSLNLEYLHYDLGSGTTFHPASYHETVGPSMNTLTLGVEYKF